MEVLRQFIDEEAETVIRSYRQSLYTKRIPCELMILVFSVILHECNCGEEVLVHGKIKQLWKMLRHHNRISLMSRHFALSQDRIKSKGS